MANGDFLLPRNERGEVLPGELDEQFLQALDQALARQEAQQIQRIGGEQESRGFLQSGQTLKRVAEEVIGPGQERRSLALLPLAKESALLGREERLGTQQFERTRQLKAEDFERRLQEIDRMASIQRDLLELQDQLEGGGLGGLLGSLGGTLLGSTFGGAGAILGQRLGSSLFGGGGPRRTPVRGPDYA